MTIEEKIEILFAYLALKVEEKDLHGVRDCCVDIEILQAVLNATKQKGEKENESSGRRVRTL